MMVAHEHPKLIKKNQNKQMQKAHSLIISLNLSMKQSKNNTTYTLPVQMYFTLSIKNAV
jgi:hypothetical protein